MFFPSRIDFLPPLLAAAACMADLGARVRVLASGSSQDSTEYLSRHGVEVCLAREGEHPKTYCARAILRARVGIELVRQVRSFKPECLWYHGQYAMEYGFLPALGGPTVIVAHAYELCDSESFLRKVLDATLRRAHVVIVPEINRLWILKLRSHSRAMFFEIPNRQLDDAVPRVDGGSRTREIFLENGGSQKCSRFLIYQGAFMGDRGLREVLHAFRGIKGEDLGLILLGGGLVGDLAPELGRLAKGDPRIAIIGRIPPPSHLAVTAGCAIGILLYSPSELNNIYCAPNKIYEYAAAGLGMILPDYPGVSALNRTYGLGELCDPEDVKSIRLAMERLLLRERDDNRRATRHFLEVTPSPKDMYRRVYECILERTIR
jgi:glycosyltransferase involved in cell wall biosynthesis